MKKLLKKLSLKERRKEFYKRENEREQELKNLYLLEKSLFLTEVRLHWSYTSDMKESNIKFNNQLDLSYIDYYKTELEIFQLDEEKEVFNEKVIKNIQDYQSKQQRYLKKKQKKEEAYRNLLKEMLIKLEIARLQARIPSVILDEVYKEMFGFDKSEIVQLANQKNNGKIGTTEEVYKLIDEIEQKSCLECNQIQEMRIQEMGPEAAAASNKLPRSIIDMLNNSSIDESFIGRDL